MGPEWQRPSPPRSSSDGSLHLERIETVQLIIPMMRDGQDIV